MNEGGMWLIQSTLVLGGARSGKSLFAEDLILRSGRRPVYLATGTAGDGEMSERIKTHRQRRGPEWTTLEEPLDLVGILRSETSPDSALLVDCLTFWLFNQMEKGADLDLEFEHLAQALSCLKGPVVLVTNEVGYSIVPENPLARRFRDNQGRLNRLIADACQRVVLVVAGQPLQIKPSPHMEIAP